MKNKKVLFLSLAVLAGTIFLSACGSAAKTPQEKYTAFLEKSAVCTTDADCMKVPKGCCQCDGYTAVNDNFVKDALAKREEMCGLAKCNRMFCRNDINVKCEKKKCVGIPRQYEFEEIEVK